MIHRLLCTVALIALTPSLAHAQIYVWHDAAGNLVLSDKAKDPSAKTFAVPTAATAGFRATRPAVSRQAVGYDDLILEHSRKQALSPDLVRALIQTESAFNSRARSVKGAMGLMQLMPATALRYGVRNPYDPAENIRAGSAYLKSLLTRYNEDESLALAAYNAGPGAVEKYGRAVPPYRETRSYVAKIRSASASHPAASATHVFKTMQLVDGREVVRYSNRRAPSAEVVRAAEGIAPPSR